MIVNSLKTKLPKSDAVVTNRPFTRANYLKRGPLVEAVETYLRKWL